MEERRIRSPHSEMCEISFLPSPTRNGNIVRTLSFREKETAVFTSGTKECEDIINLNDVYIGVFDENFMQEIDGVVNKLFLNPTICIILC